MTTAKAITTNIMVNNHTRRTLFRVLVSLLVVLSIIYIYLIGSITFNVLARKSLENTVRTLGTSVSELELTYLNTTNKIDKSYALSLGFVDMHDTLFAARQVSARVAIR
jgi:glycerol-3-phosphate acyltransferase PlsY